MNQPQEAKRELVLLVDDDGALRASFRELLEADGYDVVEAGRPDAALATFHARSPRVVVLDLMLPPSGRAEEGARILEAIVGAIPSTKVIVVSGTGETRLALDLVRRGAYDFLQKPVDPDVLEAVVARATARLALEDRVGELERGLAATADAPALLGRAPAFTEARALAEKAAPSVVPVLLRGPSGTGKELFARFVHEKSQRHAKPFITVNCGALAASLLESTLFGHKKGAFTGASADAPGLFLAADGGTLFLDEIGDLERDLQVKLLRALESGEILPVGASKPVFVDVRIVSATHRPLEDMIREGSFREDLYWRIRGIEIALPALVDRPGDIGVLAQHFLNLARPLVPRAGRAVLSPGALRRMEEHAWPGNLRELRHEMQRALVVAAGRDEILEEDLSGSIAGRVPPKPSPAKEHLEGRTLEEKIAALERREIADALSATGNNRSQAAQRLGLSRQGLLNKLARYGIG
ncbi:MAG: sigma-54-dependent Fis family transcriptional regulator [Polyangiaceae bacterium]|nr:sigma-54-dependent Fis family transcriptional regulator [Polyangiaceae bacterium]